MIVPLKKFFLKKENEDLLKLLLEIILEVKIKNINYDNVELLNDNINVKGKRLDALLETDIGKIGIEINSCNNYIRERNLAYLCNVYSKYTHIGNEYNKDLLIIQINLTYGLSWTEEQRRYYMQDNDGHKYVDNMFIIEVNMDKYKSKCYDKSKKRYLKMLNLELGELEELSKSDEKVLKFMEEIKKINKDKNFYSYMTYEEDKQTIYNIGTKKARAEGEARGEERGKNAGKKETILLQLKNGLSKDIIAKSLNMSLEDLANFIK